MYTGTCESCTQVYAILLLTFRRTTDDLMRLKFVGYDTPYSKMAAISVFFCFLAN